MSDIQSGYAPVREGKATVYSLILLSSYNLGISLGQRTLKTRYSFRLLQIRVTYVNLLCGDPLFHASASGCE